MKLNAGISDQHKVLAPSIRPDKIPLVPGIVLLNDLCFLFLAWALATLFPLQSLPALSVMLHPSIIALWVCLCICCAVQGHYTDNNGFPTEAMQIAAGVLLAALVDWSMQINNGFGVWRAVGPWMAALLLVPLGRLALKRALFQFGFWRLPAAVVGTASQCDAISDMLKDDWYRGFVVRAKVLHGDGGAAATRKEVERLTSLGMVQHVLVVVDGAAGAAARAAALEDGISLGVASLLSGVPLRRLAVDRFFGTELAVLRKKGVLSAPHRAMAKRGLDVAISATLLLLVSPLMLVIAWMIRRDGGPVFYASQRLGRGGNLFSALKFRTMAPDADRLLHDLLRNDPAARDEWETGFKLRQDPRITGIGRLLRELSLDELPQLINVLAGDMSLVGPRPLLPAERTAYGEAFQTYCRCVPGITGPWQVSGRNNLDYQQRIDLNNWYANNASFWIDMVILFRTLSVVVRRVGAI